MPHRFPYSYYACPCTDISSDFNDPVHHHSIDKENEEHTFNPHSPRAKYTLYPIEHLLFCNDCHEIRCPRCWYEETMYHFCPNCLFETTKSAVQNETNRCTRSCYQCPICVSTLALKSFKSQSSSKAQAEASSTQEGPFILSCPYCTWSTLEIGIQFEKSTNISAQLAKIQNDTGDHSLSAQESAGHSDREDHPRTAKADSNLPDRFANLASFYKTQLAEIGSTNSGPGLSSTQFTGLDSPNLSRLLSNYGGGGLKKPKGKPTLMREALAPAEGLILDSPDEEQKLVTRMQHMTWSDTVSVTQRTHQATSCRFLQDVRPFATVLRSKRARRCRTCRHQLAKQEEKRHSTRFKIRLVAANHIPSVTCSMLDNSVAQYDRLRPGTTVQYLLTFRNPLFDPVKITLATPRVTPGKVKNKVTILCPQFEVGASTDVWDEALDNGGKRNATDTSVGSSHQAEAGKVWDRGRNWTSIICEVMPGLLENGEQLDDSGTLATEENHYENSDLLEIPLFVRVEYETEDASVDSGSPKLDKDKKVQKEVAFWCVLGAGRLAGP